MSTYDFSNLDFDSLKQNLIEYIKLSDDFKDYNFEGSALNSLASLLTYVTIQQNYYLNMTTQELYLDTATLYKNAVAIAKSLNYLPHRKKASTLPISLKVNTEKLTFLESTWPILIPQNCKFDVEGTPFITDTSYNLNSSSDELSIVLFQRELKEETFTFDGSLIELKYGYEIDDDFLTVVVDGDIWGEYLNDITANSSSEIYFVETNLDEKVQISFGDNTIGKKPTIGSEIKVTYGVTLGYTGNGVIDTKLNQTVSGTDGTEYSANDFIITTTNVSAGGLDKESLGSIKVNAPKFYSTQNRAVTTYDYQSILNSVPFVELLNVWDGSTESPPTYGTVFATFKPFSGPDLLTDIQKSEILNYIQDYKPLSITLQIVDPIYIYVDFDIKVYYYTSFNSSTSAIQSEIEDNISEYFANNLLVYDTKLKYSNVVNVIDTPSVVSNNLTELTLHVKFDKTSISSNNYSFDIKNKLQPNSIINEFVKDDGNGNIINISTSETIGSVDYEKGLIDFIFDGMNLTNNLLYFKTYLDDVEFIRNNLPVLGTKTFTFYGV